MASIVTDMNATRSASFVLYHVPGSMRCYTVIMKASLQRAQLDEDSIQRETLLSHLESPYMAMQVYLYSARYRKLLGCEKTIQYYCNF